MQIFCIIDYILTPDYQDVTVSILNLTPGVMVRGWGGPKETIEVWTLVYTLLVGMAKVAILDGNTILWIFWFALAHLPKSALSGSKTLTQMREWPRCGHLPASLLLLFPN